MRAFHRLWGVPATVTWSAAVGELLLAERDRWVLWLPVAMGCGVIAYRAVPVELPWWLGGVLLAGALAVVPTLRRGAYGMIVAAPVLAAIIGLTCAQIETALVAGPPIEQRQNVQISARLVQIDPQARSVRLTLDRLDIAGWPPGAVPGRVRLNARPSAVIGLEAGMRINLRARLEPWSGPALPGAFDLQSHQFFAGLLGTGVVIGRALPAPAMAGDDDWRMRLARLRVEMTRRILAALPGDTGAVAAALLAGDQTHISEEMKRAYRDSGLAHLLSISGLHIAMVVGMVMLVLRRGLALIPFVALRYPIKKWAAIIAFLAAWAYALLAGWSVPTQRSFVMAGFALIAILIDRDPFTMRVLAAAAAVIFLTAPSALLGPSFQMSFAAVLALIAYAEATAHWQTQLQGWRGRVGYYLVGLIATSLVTTVATAPFAAFHFGRVALYGVIANGIAVPLSGVLIMPAALLSALAMPFGLEAWPLRVLGWGVDWINATAIHVADWPGAVWSVAGLQPAVPLLFTLGLLWICLWQTGWRWLGGLPIAAAILHGWLLSPLPVLLASADGRLLGLHSGGRLLLFGDVPRARLTARIWQEKLNSGPPEAMIDATLPGLSCAARLCRWDSARGPVLFAQGPEDLPDPCPRDAVVLLREPGRWACRGVPIRIDRFTVWRSGAAAVYAQAAGWRLETVRDGRGVRPWAPAPETRRERLAALGIPPPPAPPAPAARAPRPAPPPSPAAPVPNIEPWSPPGEPDQE